MQLDRNNSITGYCNKFAVINRRKLSAALAGDDGEEIKAALNVMRAAGLIEFGEPNSENEFFVVKLKDKFAPQALFSYAAAAFNEGGEFEQYGREVGKLAERSGSQSPYCKLPD